MSDLPIVSINGKEIPVVPEEMSALERANKAAAEIKDICTKYRVRISIDHAMNVTPVEQIKPVEK